MIEQDLLDLFRDTLDFDRQNAERQVKSTNGKQIDIQLMPNQSTPIIVEVKRPGEFNTTQRKNAALIQAAKYSIMASGKENYGAATDGVNWTLFVAKPFRNYYRVHRLACFNLKEQAPIGKAILKRAKKGTQNES